MIDLYCERTGPGLWAEPVNLLTNLGFLVAAYALWRLIQRQDLDGFDSRLLLGLIVAIGAGSALFHAFATDWAGLLDRVPILLFQLSLLWLYGRRVVMLSRPAMNAIMVFFVFTLYLGAQFPQLFNQSLSYAPALLFLLGIALYHRITMRNERSLILWACLLFFVSLLFRSIDIELCSRFALGTHFLWHLCDAGVLYMVSRAYLINRRTVIRPEN